MNWFQRQQEGHAPCVCCRKPTPAEELSPSKVCVRCWIRDGEAKGWSLDARRVGRVPWVLDDQCVWPKPSASAERAGEEGRRHVVTSLHASINLARVGLMVIRCGDGLPAKFYCHTYRDIDFGAGFPVPAGESVMVGFQFRDRELPEATSATVVAVGYTQDER